MKGYTDLMKFCTDNDCRFMLSYGHSRMMSLKVYLPATIQVSPIESSFPPEDLDTVVTKVIAKSQAQIDEHRHNAPVTNLLIAAFKKGPNGFELVAEITADNQRMISVSDLKALCTSGIAVFEVNGLPNWWPAALEQHPIANLDEVRYQPRDHMVDAIVDEWFDIPLSKPLVEWILELEGKATMLVWGIQIVDPVAEEVPADDQ